MSALLIFTVLSILSVTRADDRAHGLANESPIAISPQSYAFFHPNALQPSANNPCGSSNRSSLPLAATTQTTPASTSGRRGIGAGRIAGISLGFVSACLIGMGAYYVVIKRRAGSIARISLGFVSTCLIGMGVYYVVIKRRANMRKPNPEQLA
ncbi:hypothetical protein BUALT_Bualt13G0076200 [Buddleja alternifolia]|uniref:Transmembrane protein n=1 Tax=Buddleja alternifolia TaxID=168488 RepID=A0AAV6WUM8_9LAMI|nr:hypothetical protein BUALT_Bualt13G0076200 [Buddleja alternifolia]